jgi:hypothetical protein
MYAIYEKKGGQLSLLRRKKRSFWISTRQRKFCDS